MHNAPSYLGNITYIIMAPSNLPQLVKVVHVHGYMYSTKKMSRCTLHITDL